MSKPAKAFPRELLLLDGKTVKVTVVHYGLGKAYYRVQYDGPDRAMGCIGYWDDDEDLFVERTHEDLLADARRVLAGRAS